MALNLTNIQYNGKELMADIIRNVYSTSLFHKDFGARIMEVFKSKFYWWDAGLELTINNGISKCPTFNTSFNLNQNEGVLCNYDVAFEIEDHILDDTAREMNTRAGASTQRFTDDQQLFDSLIAMLFESIAYEQDCKFLNDSIYYDACQNGIIEQIKTGMFDATITINRPVPVGNIITTPAFTSTNVQSNFNLIIDALEGKYRDSVLYGRAKLLVARNVADKYSASLTYKAPADAGSTDDLSGTIVPYRGHAIVVADCLSDDQVIFSGPKNFGLIYDKEQDMTNLNVKNGGDDSTLCYATRGRMSWRSAVMFGEGEAIVAANI